MEVTHIYGCQRSTVRRHVDAKDVLDHQNAALMKPLMEDSDR